MHSHRRLLVTVGIMVALLLTGGVLFAATNQQSASGSPIYYVSTSSGDSDIWSVVPGSKPVRMPWNAKGIPDVDPAVSPDGRWLAFSSRRTGDYEIWVVDLQAGAKAKPYQVTKSTARDRNPAWSPDASQIAYETDAYGPEEIMIAPAKGCDRLEKGCPVRITNNKDRDLQPAWSPDGKLIAFATQRKGDAALQVYTMTPSGTSLRRLTSDKAASSEPSWSPDGGNIAFISIRSTDKTPSVYTMSSTGANQRRISAGNTNDSHPTWSPDGREVAFTSHISLNFDVYRVSASGGKATRVTTSGSADQDPSWALPATQPTPTPSPTAVPTATPNPVPTATATVVPPTATSVPTATATSTSGSGGGVSLDHVREIFGFVVVSEGSDAQGWQDNSWMSFTGGELAVELIDNNQPDQFSNQTVGRRFITDLEFRGPLQVQNGSQESLLTNGVGRFTLEVEGLPDFGSRLQSISIEPLQIDAVDVTSGASSQSLLFQPGLPVYGRITVTLGRSADSEVLFQWWEDYSNGQDIRKQLTVTALDRTGNPARQWTFIEAIPLNYSHTGPELSGGSSTGLETLVLEYSRVQFDTFETLRADMLSHLNAVIVGETSNRSITLTEKLEDGSDGTTFTYNDVFPTRYVFPQFSVENEDLLIEEIHFRANSFEQQ